MTRLLLEGKKYDVVVTEDMVKKTAGNCYGTKEIMLLLLDRLKDSGRMLDEILNVILEKCDTREKIMRDITSARRDCQQRLRTEELQIKGLPNDYNPEAEYDL